MRYFPPTCFPPSLDRFHRGKGKLETLVLSCLVTRISYHFLQKLSRSNRFFVRIYIRIPSFPKLKFGSSVIREKEKEREIATKFEERRWKRDYLTLSEQIYLSPAIFSDKFSDSRHTRVEAKYRTNWTIGEQQKPIKIQSFVFASVWKRFPTRARKI